MNADDVIALLPPKEDHANLRLIIECDIAAAIHLDADIIEHVKALETRLRLVGFNVATELHSRTSRGIITRPF